MAMPLSIGDVARRNRGKTVRYYERSLSKMLADFSRTLDSIALEGPSNQSQSLVRLKNDLPPCVKSAKHFVSTAQNRRRRIERETLYSQGNSTGQETSHSAAHQMLTQCYAVMAAWVERKSA
jgi:hypothetical protein